MGKKKLETKKIEDEPRRKATLGKRKNGLIKKVKELSVMCDIQTLVMFRSREGKLEVCSMRGSMDGSKHENVTNDIISRYANTPESERTKAKEENEMNLKKLRQKVIDEQGCGDFTVSETDEKVNKEMPSIRFPAEGLPFANRTPLPVLDTDGQ